MYKSFFLFFKLKEVFIEGVIKSSTYNGNYKSIKLLLSEPHKNLWPYLAACDANNNGYIKQKENIFDFFSFFCFELKR